MDLPKTGILGLLVLVMTEISLACQCNRGDRSLTGSYCHRLADQTETTALIKGTICRKEFDDGFAEHFMVIDDIYLEPMFFEKFPGPPQTIMPDYFSDTPNCATVPHAHSYRHGPGQTMLLTSHNTRGGLCGIPYDLHINQTYVMEIIYSGAVFDITFCAYHKNWLEITSTEAAMLQTFKSLRNPPPGVNPVPPPCPSDPLPTGTPVQRNPQPARGNRW